MLSFAGNPPSAVGPSAAGITLGAKTSRPASLAGPTTNLSNGITFDHASLNDPVRMVGEPNIQIDNNDGIYVSGPGGSTTQTSWFWKSEDKGVQWHIVGCPDKSNCQNGGGDTEIAFGTNSDVFGSDLQTLACNSAIRSLDGGKTFTTSEACFPGTDRQWMATYDPNASATGRRIYLAANGQAQGCYCLVSTDNGVSYLPPDPTGNPDASIGGSCIGRIAVSPVNGHIYAPVSGGTRVSTDGGVTWLTRPGPGAQANFFANIALDTAGNLWQGWTTGCSAPATTPCKAFISYSTNEGQTWHSAIQVNTGVGSPVGTSPSLRQMLFPWIAVGDPGRVALVYYATDDATRVGGYPGGTNALWHAYASISTNAMDANPTFTQVQTGEHAMHRSTVCTGGFPGCLTANSDRSMADFFMVDKDSDGRLFIAYNENSDLSLVVPAPAEYIGKPINAVMRLRTGPSLFAAKGNLLPHPLPANVAISSAAVSAGTLSVAGTQGLPPGNWTTDPANDAPFPVIPVTSANHPALDLLEASVGDDGTNLTFKLTMADLSPAALADAATAGGIPSWMVTWFESKNGLGPAAMTPPYYSHWFVKWLGGTQFVYGTVSSFDFLALGAPTPKFLTYTPAGTATGTVVGNVVTISVPLASAGPLVAGDKMDHIIAYSLVEKNDVTLNDWADQAKSFSYLVGTPPARQHLVDGYVEVSLDNFATSTLAVFNNTNNAWTASLPASGSGTVCARQVLARDLYTPLWDDVQAGPVSCANFGAPIPTSAVSRKTHGGVGDFDVDLPAVGTPGIECRTGGANGDHRIVVTFPNPVTVSGFPNASVTAGTGTVSNTTVSGAVVTIDLTGVTNAQTIAVTIFGVSDGINNGNVIVPMSVLAGDTNADTAVNSADISQTKAQSGNAVSGSNFREDVTIDGNLNSADIGLVKSKSGTALLP